MKRAAAPGYDLFKAIVAVILGAILLLILLLGCATNAVPLAPTEVVTSPVATELTSNSALPTETVLAASPVETLTTTTIPPTAKATSTPTASSSNITVTVKPTQAVTSTPAQAKATPEQTQNVSCNTSSPSRLSVGQTARVLQRLNVRSDASIQAPIIQVNPTTTQVEIVGGPVCEVVGKRAYLWWQVRFSDGTEGWSAETPLNNPAYFLEPVQ